MSIRVRIFSIILTLLSSCYKDHLYVQQEWVDQTFLASMHVNTPDPRQECPPCGQRLLVAWRFPSNMIDYGLNLILTVRFWDNSEEEVCRRLESSRGYEVFNFFDEEILTYRIQIFDDADNLIETWEHHFWTKLIDIY